MKKGFENRSICAKCGGLCCKRSGCSYYVSDIKEMTVEYIIKMLDSGQTSVAGNILFKKNNEGKIYSEYYLFLRTRNINREAIDLYSLNTACALLKEDGCPFTFAERPSSAKMLKPKRNHKCQNKGDNKKELDNWLRVQDILEEVVLRYAGIRAQEIISQDVENLFYDLEMQNFEYVTKEEVEDFRGIYINLVQCYPKEFYNAFDRINNDKYTRNRTIKNS